jgi:hypothetical protein
MISRDYPPHPPTSPLAARRIVVMESAIRPRMPVESTQGLAAIHCHRGCRGNAEGPLSGKGRPAGLPGVETVGLGMGCLTGLE